VEVWVFEEASWHRYTPLLVITSPQNRNFRKTRSADIFG